MLFEIRHEPLKILDRHPPLRPARRQSRQIRRMQTQLLNPCLHSWRQITRSRRSGRHRQPLNRRRYPMAISISPIFLRSRLPHPTFCPFLFFLTPASFRRLLFCASSHFDVSKNSPHCITLSLLSLPLLPYPSITRRHTHDCFTCLNLCHLLIRFNRFAWLYLEPQ